MWQWLDGTVALYYNITPSPQVAEPNCAVFDVSVSSVVRVVCDVLRVLVLCDFTAGKADQHSQSEQQSEISLPVPEVLASSTPGMVECHDATATWNFLSCYSRSRGSSPVRDFKSGNVCSEDLSDLADARFSCDDGGCVPFTLVCDFRHDCEDGSDEVFCAFPPCSSRQIACKNSKQVSSFV